MIYELASTVNIAGTTCRAMECATCGVHYALPTAIYESCKREGGYFSCPNGHQRGWSKQDCDSENDKLRREIERAKQNAARLEEDAEAARRREIAAKGQVTRLRNRAKAGLCPCCNRHFTNLERHIASKHPDMEPAETPELKMVAGGKT